MAYIPHPAVPLGRHRPSDVALLLMIGAIWELLVRSFLLFLKKKPAAVLLREGKLSILESRVIKSRALGPPAFVETSKLERQKLAEEKALEKLASTRETKLKTCEKFCKKLDIGVCLAILFIWYGVPMIEFSAYRIHPDAGSILTAEEAGHQAITAFKAFLFPLSFVGMGIKISKWGMPSPNSSIGALLVFWASQTTVGQIFDGIEALVL